MTTLLNGSKWEVEKMPLNISFKLIIITIRSNNQE